VGLSVELDLELIRGPTHITHTDVWVSRGDTLSLFKRFGDWVSGAIDLGRGFKSLVKLALAKEITP